GQGQGQEQEQEQEHQSLVGFELKAKQIKGSRAAKALWALTPSIRLSTKSFYHRRPFGYPDGSQNASGKRKLRSGGRNR
ncbi:hypothetical protein, partial [Pseudomonas savastanoi]|uniref:hypothetical protein n=1 Tax=Pseudomonas savastanoi TaxID=29438 RepID=UPI001C819180